MNRLVIYFWVSLAMLGGLVATIFSQTTGNSDPSGFLTLSVFGTQGAGPSRNTFLGLGVTRPVEYQRTASAITSNTITDSGANWTPDQFATGNGPYFVEITSVNGSQTGTGVGTTYGILSNSSNTLTLGSNLAAGIVAPVGYKIRKQWTIAAVFGPNDETGLQGGGPSTADLVQLWNGALLESYYYQTTGGGTGWRRVGDTTTDQSGTVIPFYSAIVIVRQQNDTLRFVLNGTVKSGQTAIPIALGDNYVGNVYPANLTLGGSQLYTGNDATGLIGGSSSTADQVLIWNDTTFDIYYYQTTGAGGTGWRKVGAESIDASGTILAESSGFIIRRRNGGNFTWIVPEKLTNPTGTTPTPTPGTTATPTPGVTPTPTSSPSGTATPTPGTTPTPTPVTTATPTPGITPTATPGGTSTPSPTPTPSSSVTPTPSPSLTPSQAVNLSTRMRVETGESVGIGGFIISGTGPKHVLLRAIGPSLFQAGVANALSDPVLELHGPGAFSTITNNNWQDDPEQAAAISATGIAPTNELESAIDLTLDPGAYTAIVRGNNGVTGVGLVEVYDLAPTVSANLSNISTRAFVGVTDEVVIAGFILGNNPGTDRVAVRGLGPSLSGSGVANVVADPKLELRDSNGGLLRSNNDWQDDPSQASEITGAGLAPSDNVESALVASLQPGLYTALLMGANNGIGIGLVEVYDLP